MAGSDEAQLRELELGISSVPDTYVCASCVEDDALQEVVNDNLVANRCSYCKKRSKSREIAASLDVVVEHIAECISQEFTDPVNELPYESAEGGYQGNMSDIWEVLCDIGFEVSNAEFFEDVRGSFTQTHWCKVNYFELAAPDRLRYGWDDFKRVVKHQRRFTFWSMNGEEVEFPHPDDLPPGKMLAELAKTIRTAGLIKVLEPGQLFWRARVHPSGKRLVREDQLSPPPIAKATQPNRMSPSGIPMFYGAEDRQTALRETVDVKRDGGNGVTSACFTSSIKLSILDLVDLPSSPSFFRRDSSALRDALQFLRLFVSDVSQPFKHDGREHIEYVPTQAFTEYVRFLLKTEDETPIDGIRYASARNGRPCVVLFCGQDNCISKPKSRDATRWLRFDSATLRSKPVSRRSRKKGK